MHELPPPLKHHVAAGLEAAHSANAVFDDLTLLKIGHYSQLHTPEEIAASQVAHNASFDALVTAAGNLIGKQSLLASESIRDQQLYLAGAERLRAPSIVLHSEVEQDAAQSDETLHQIAENRAAIRDGIDQAFEPYIQAFLNKMPHPDRKPRRFSRIKSCTWDTADAQGGHTFTMHYRESPQGAVITRVECKSLFPQTAVNTYNDALRQRNMRGVTGAVLFPPYVVGCQFEKGVPVELSLNWPRQMFNSNYLQLMGRTGNLIGRPKGNAELRQPSAVLHHIGAVAEQGLGRTQITLNLRGTDPIIALKQTSSDAFASSTLMQVLVGVSRDVSLGSYAYNSQKDCFEAPGMPYPPVQGQEFGSLVADILRYFPTLQEQGAKS